MLRLLDEGGTAKVYLAYACSAAGPQFVVLKQLRSFAARDPEVRRMFHAEVRIGLQLVHPNVVRTFDVLAQGDSLSLVMEYLEGQSYARVRDRLCAGLAPELRLALHIHVLAEVLAGLGYAHALADEAGSALHLVHRDVSPQNVLLGYDGGVKLLDFGLAQHGLDARARSARLGKVGYAAPELFTGRDVDARADLFAVGVMLWEALSGHRLWQGLAADAIVDRLRAGDLPQLADAGRFALADLCARAISPRPSERPASALAFRTELLAAAPTAPLAAGELGRLVAEAFRDEREALRAFVVAQRPCGGEESATAR